MMAWIVGKVKWLLLIGAVGGPVMAYLGYSGAVEIRDVLAQGQEATATIDGGSIRKGRKSGTSYSVNLSWTDKTGQKLTADKVSITSRLADQIIVGDKIVRDTVKIKYLAGAAETKPVILEDAELKITNSQEMVPLGLGACLVGAIGSAFFLLRRQQATA